MKFKEGQKVKIKEYLKEGNHVNEVYVNKYMEQMAGKVVTISNTKVKMFGKCRYKIKEDHELWTWDEDMFENYSYTWKRFKKCPVGTKVTFEGGETLVKIDRREHTQELFDCFENADYSRNYGDLVNFRDNFGLSPLGKIVKIEEPKYLEVFNPQDTTEEMTLEEVCKELGRNIKIVKKEGK